jgi:hypothetical protein
MLIYSSLDPTWPIPLREATPPFANSFSTLSVSSIRSLIKRAAPDLRTSEAAWPAESAIKSFRPRLIAGCLIKPVNQFCCGNGGNAAS